MDFDLRTLNPGNRYKIIGSCITPRPIAWVTSVSGAGVLNTSPFSFFNAVGNNPPSLVLGIVAQPDGRLKDTAANIRDVPEFVVSLVDEAHAARMNLTSTDAPSDVDEAGLAGLEMVPSTLVRPPRIATVPVSFECKLMHYIETGPSQVVIIAEILMAHIRDELVLDPDRITLDIPAMNLVSRLHGAGYYGRQTDTFEMFRPSWKDVSGTAK